MERWCSQCGKRLGGLMGAVEATEEEFEELQDAGLEILEPICHRCYYLIHCKLEEAPDTHHFPRKEPEMAGPVYAVSAPVKAIKISKCSQCGRTLDTATGIAKATPEELGALSAAGLQVQEPLCRPCCFRLSCETYNDAPEHAAAKERAIIPISTIVPYRHTEYEILGIVSAYAPLKTSPADEWPASIDALGGVEFENYNAKMLKAESICFKKLTSDAKKMGASEIIGLQISCSELTREPGIILLNMHGTAILRKR